MLEENFNRLGATTGQSVAHKLDFCSWGCQSPGTLQESSPGRFVGVGESQDTLWDSATYRWAYHCATVVEC